MSDELIPKDLTAPPAVEVEHPGRFLNLLPREGLWTCSLHGDVIGRCESCWAEHRERKARILAIGNPDA